MRPGSTAWRPRSPGRSRSVPVAPSAAPHEHPRLAVAVRRQPRCRRRARGTQGRRRRRRRAGRARRPAPPVRGTPHAAPDPRRRSLGRRRAAQALAESERAHDESAALAATPRRPAWPRWRGTRAADDELRDGPRRRRLQRQTDLESRLELHRTEQRRLRDRIDEVLDGTGCETVAALRKLRSRQLEALAQACAAHEHWRWPSATSPGPSEPWPTRPPGPGFESVADARRARLEDERARSAGRRARARRRGAAGCSQPSPTTPTTAPRRPSPGPTWTR